MKRILLVLNIIVLISANVVSEQSDFPKLSGLYLGQKPPGMTAELFAPGIVSIGNFEHSSPVFTPDLSEIYWSTIIEENGKAISRPTYYMKLENGIWSKPQIPSFGRQLPICENPFISPDGKRLFFAASPNMLIPHKRDLYYVERINGDWGIPIKLEESVNTIEYNEFSPSVSENGTIFFSGFYENAKYQWGLYYSNIVDGKYQKKILMEEKFNNLYLDWTPYISPDESYFIFCSIKESGFGSGDLYICFKEKDGSWGKVINMGDKVNTDANERFPNVTPDGKYLFFNSTKKIEGADPNGPGNEKGDIYWIDAKIIEELRP